MSQFEYATKVTDPLAAELVGFFRGGYGDRFLGDAYFRQAYIELASGVTTLRDERGSILAAQIIRNGRLTASATTPAPTEHGPRRGLMANLLVQTRNIEPLGWVTVHTGAKGMEAAVETAGMQKLLDPEDIHRRLERFGEVDLHRIAAHAGGMAVALQASRHGDAYTQLAWGWGGLIPEQRTASENTYAHS